MKDYNKDYNTTSTPVSKNYSACRVHNKKFVETTTQVSNAIPSTNDLEKGTPVYIEVDNLTQLTNQIAKDAKTDPTAQVDVATLKKYDEQLQKTIQTLTKNRDAVTQVNTSELQKALNAFGAIFGIKNAFDPLFEGIKNAQKQIGTITKPLDDFAGKLGKTTNVSKNIHEVQKQFGVVGDQLKKLGDTVSKDVKKTYGDTTKVVKGAFNKPTNK